MIRIIWTFYFLLIIFLTIAARGEEIRNKSDVGITIHPDASVRPLVVESDDDTGYLFNFENQQLTGWISTNDWLISSEGKINGNFSLRHSSKPSSPESVIFYPVNLKLDADYRWNITLKNGNWDPSSSNRFWYYLLADSSNPSELNGWAVGVNITGSSDILELWRFKNGQPDSLVVQSNLVWKTNTQFQIEVERRGKGKWSLASTNASGGQSEPAKGTDFATFDFNFIGLHFDYTSTRAGQLWADDIAVTGLPVPPFIEKITVLNEERLELTFNKEIDPASVKNQNFKLFSSSGKPLNIVNSIAPAPEKIELTVEKPSEFDLNLIVSGISDRAGLQMETDTLTFCWILPCREHSLAVNEIFADPNPSQGLPEYEYLELFNRTYFPVSLANLKLKVNEKECSFESTPLYPGKYLLLTNAEGAAFFENSIGLKNFPTLLNSGAKISIETPDGLLIDEINYSDSWYADDDKKNGGWSLERIDPNRFCNQPGNWSISINEKGGTPGAKNSVNRENMDQLPAKITLLKVISANQVDVYFSEAVESGCISSLNNFKLKNFNIFPDSLFVVNPKQVSLFFGQGFTPKINYCLEMSELIDLCGNRAIDKSENFVFYEPDEHSLVITEIFADPYPSAGLPEYEYIEIFNRTDYPITLNNIQIQIETKRYRLGENTIRPQQYFVLTSSEGALLLNNAFAVGSFPSLRNSSGNIQLIYNETKVVDFIEYTDDWYRDSEKREGGWSLERIDNNRFCGQANNWTASVAPAGGSPGGKNSVAADNQDTGKPEIIGLEVVSANRIKLLFSENIVPELLENLKNYLVSPSIGHPLQVETNGAAEAILIFSENFVPNTNYSLQVSGLTDECGNTTENDEHNFGLQQLNKDDILISEVLFNPYPSGADFVEIYNHSEKTVNLKNLRLANRDEQSELKDVCKLCDNDYWLQPGGYVLCTGDSSAVRLFYHTRCPECFCEMASFPSFPDDRGTVVLLSDSLQVLDEFQYSEKMHHPLLDDCEGISLERLSFESATASAANWHSAASSVGFATPGYANSQQREELQTKENIVLSPEVFSPNNDGYNDRLLIHYQLEKPGYSGNVKIYDSQGRLVRHLVKNEILGQEGDWYWDGEKADNTRPGLGIYIVLVELFDMNGNVKKYRRTCTLTDRL